MRLVFIIIILISQESTMAIQMILPIRHANLLPVMQDGAIILPASQHMNSHLIEYISWQILPVGMFQTTNKKS